MHYKIITDSCGDHPESDGFSWIHRVPLTINLGEKSYVDEQLDTKVLLEDIANSALGPKSACPSPGDFLESYQGEHSDVYVVTLSKELSATYESAMQAAQIFKEEHPEKNVHVFNSRSAAAGQISICAKINELAQSGMEFSQVVAEVEEHIQNMGTIFVLEDLDILRKNGRLNKLQAAVTGTLRIKLVMGATKEGTIQKVTQALSMTQALNKMCAYITSNVEKEGGTLNRLVITHCFAKERAEFVKDKLKSTLQVKETIICKAGGISTMYANRGGIIVSYR